MTMFLAGLIGLIGIHLFSANRPLRASMIDRLGLMPYRGLYSLAALVALAVLVIGFAQYRSSGLIPVWSPPAFLRHPAMLLLLLAMVALVAAYAPNGLIRSKLKHPMLVGVKAWATAHLLVNGDLGGIILFGTLLAYAVFARITLKRRPDAVVPPAAGFGTGDVIAIVGGVVLTAVIYVWAHGALIGIALTAR